MIQPARPANDVERVQALHALNVLDTPREERFDRITRDLAMALGVPISYVALVDEDRQWLKSEIGGMPCQVSRGMSFCGHTILSRKPLVLSDARKDPRFAENPMVIGKPFLRFYTGIPLTAGDQHVVGTLCVADTQPRQLTPAELGVIQQAAQQVERIINAKPNVFISYSHRDEASKDRLLRHLNVLQNQGLLTLWDDRRMDAGDAWRNEIETAIEASNVAVLLVSASFLSSRFVLDVEVPRLLRRRDQEGLRIVPLIVEPCCWDCVPWLEPLNLFPKNAEPLSIKEKHEIERELAGFAGHILEQARQPARAPIDRGPLPLSATPLPSPTPLEDQTQPVAQPEARAPAEPPEAADLDPHEETHAAGDESGTVAIQRPPKCTLHLTVRDLETPGKPPEIVRFRQQRIVIGRNRHCDLPLTDAQRRVSGRHAEIVSKDDSFHIVDLKSTNLTLIDDEPLEPGRWYPLATGMSIEIGTFALEVKILRPPSAQSTAEVTFLDLSFVNLFEAPAGQLGDLLRKFKTTYEAMAPGRRDVALKKALADHLGDQSGNPVLPLISRFLDPS